MSAIDPPTAGEKGTAHLDDLAAALLASESENDHLRASLEPLLYAITGDPRLFRWRNGVIEWCEATRSTEWHALPMVTPVGRSPKDARSVVGADPLDDGAVGDPPPPSPSSCPTSAEVESG